MLVMGFPNLLTAAVYLRLSLSYILYINISRYTRVMDQSPYHPPPSANCWTALAHRRLFSRALLSVDVQLSPNICATDNSTPYYTLGNRHPPGAPLDGSGGGPPDVRGRKQTHFGGIIYIYYIHYTYTDDAFLHYPILTS